MQLSHYTRWIAGEVVISYNIMRNNGTLGLVRVEQYVEGMDVRINLVGRSEV